MRVVAYTSHVLLQADKLNIKATKQGEKKEAAEKDKEKEKEAQFNMQIKSISLSGEEGEDEKEQKERESKAGAFLHLHRNVRCCFSGCSSHLVQLFCLISHRLKALLFECSS